MHMVRAASLSAGSRLSAHREREREGRWIRGTSCPLHHAHTVGLHVLVETDFACVNVVGEHITCTHFDFTYDWCVFIHVA